MPGYLWAEIQCDDFRKFKCSFSPLFNHIFLVAGRLSERKKRRKKELGLKDKSMMHAPLYDGVRLEVQYLVDIFHFCV